MFRALAETNEIAVGLNLFRTRREIENGLLLLGRQDRA